MKVRIDGDEYETAPPGDWSFDEARTVKRLTGLRAGEVFLELLEGDALASLALAIVGHMRAKPGIEPGYLLELQIQKIVVDFGGDKPEEAAAGGPPAGGAAEAPAADPSPPSS